MSSEFKNKAIRPDYEPSPFYFWESAIPDCPRLIAWSADCRQIRCAMFSLLDTFTGEVDILLKRLHEDPGKRGYDRWHGTTTVEKLRTVIDEDPRYVFQFAWDVLCLLNTESREYIALDEYGTLFFYSSDQRHGRLLENCGFEQRENELISADGLYMQTDETQAERRQRFIDALGLEKVWNDLD